MSSPRLRCAAAWWLNSTRRRRRLAGQETETTLRKDHASDLHAQRPN
jgi:hypothetical protein